jgi:AhpC/TSA family protein
MFILSVKSVIVDPACRRFHWHPSTKGRKARKGPLAMLDLLPVGSQAPDFSLPATDGQTFTLSELAGRTHVVLVFYVGDNTPD